MRGGGGKGRGKGREGNEKAHKSKMSDVRRRRLTAMQPEPEWGINGRSQPRQEGQAAEPVCCVYSRNNANQVRSLPKQGAGRHEKGGYVGREVGENER